MAVAVVNAYGGLNAYGVPVKFMGAQRVTYTTSTLTGAVIPAGASYVGVVPITAGCHAALAATAAATDKFCPPDAETLIDIYGHDGTLKVALYDGTS